MSFERADYKLSLERTNMRVFTLNRITRRECVSGHTVQATAHRGVIYNSALCVLSANPDAGIETFVTNTGFV